MQKRDLTKSQMEYRLRKLGFTPEGFFGYWKGPSGTSISAWNAGSRRRDQLRYLVREDKKCVERELARERRASGI
jgi:hypothetical protein